MCIRDRLQALAAEDMAVAALLQEVDTLIDGPYIEDERDLTLQFRGSANQRIIDLRRIREGKETL